MTEKITPICRYEHGNLLKVENEDGGRWAFLSGEDRQVGFMGNLFVCIQCGYTEFFDDAPAETLKRYGKQ